MQYTLEIEIEQPREQVAALFGDPENLGAWQPGFLKCEDISSDPGQAGSVCRLSYLHGKREVELMETIEVANLPEEFSARFEAPGMVMTVRNRFEEAGPDKTKWISDNDAQVSGFMMRLMTILMPGCFRKQSWKYMENFKAFAEEGRDLRKDTAA